MRFLIVVSLLVSYVFALSGGVYPRCNGIEWHSSPNPDRGIPGKVCIHCNNGKQIRLYVTYAKGGKTNYYTLSNRFVAQGYSTAPAIERLCR